jgi:hypothetical protein
VDMKFLILLIIIISSSWFSLAQNPSVFTWNPKKMDSVTKLMHKTKYSEKIVDVKVGVVHLKYSFEPEGNLIGVIYTYQGNRLMYLTPIYISTQNYIDEVQKKINDNKEIIILYRAEYEMVIFNRGKKIYTVLYIDKDSGLLFMCHSLINPMNKIIKKSM